MHLLFFFVQDCSHMSFSQLDKSIQNQSFRSIGLEVARTFLSKGAAKTEVSHRFWHFKKRDQKEILFHEYNHICDLSNSDLMAKLSQFPLEVQTAILEIRAIHGSMDSIFYLRCSPSRKNAVRIQLMKNKRTVSMYLKRVKDNQLQATVMEIIEVSRHCEKNHRS